MQKIIITGGGTAGHVIPLLALNEKMSKQFEVHFVGRTQGIEKELAQSNRIIYHGIDCPKFVRGKFFQNLKVPFSLFKAVKKAKKLLEDLQPEMIISKGGYVSLPVCLASKHIPVFLHESDTSLGLANKIVARKACAIFSSFPLKPYKGKTPLLTGSPLRKEIYSGSKEKGLKLCNFDGKKKVLLIIGGSLGAKALNDVVDANLSSLTKLYDVVHVRGINNNVPQQKGYYPISFTQNIYDLFAIADLAVTRGGGNTIFELGALGVPMLIVPLPKGTSRGDQVKNAEYFQTHRLAKTLPQERLRDLLSELKLLESDAENLKAYMHSYSFDGTKKIFDEICKIVL